MKNILFTLVFFLGTSCLAMAQSFVVDGINYWVTGNGEVAVQKNDYSGVVNIPETVANEGTIYRVTAIADRAFENCYSLTSVTIPNTVKSIGYAAFYYCNNLTSVAIPNSVENLEGYVFFYCEKTGYSYNR